MGGNFGRKALTGAALLALAAASACSRKPEPPSSAPVAASSGQPAPASSAPPPPLSFQQTTPAASVALKLPAELTREPELHRRLYAAEVKDLKAFSDSAKAEFAEMGDSASGALPSEKREDWSVAADTSKLLSLRSLTYEFDTGGAHPNLVYGAILWDKALKRPITLVSLFKPGADLAPVGAALCDGPQGRAPPALRRRRARRRRRRLRLPQARRHALPAHPLDRPWQGGGPDLPGLALRAGLDGRGPLRGHRAAVRLREPAVAGLRRRVRGPAGRAQGDVPARRRLKHDGIRRNRLIAESWLRIQKYRIGWV